MKKPWIANAENIKHRTRYEERLGRVTAYIHDHLDDELDLQKLAEIACLSPYHWHRVYHAVYGESIVEAVKRLRLQRAAAQLAQGTKSIAEIATQSGYRSLSSFTRSFTSVFGMPPARFRNHGSHKKFTPEAKERTSAVYDIEITTVPTLHVISIAHIGPYLQIGRAFDTLLAVLGPRNFITSATRLVGIYHDDPATVPEAKLRSRAGAIIDAGISIEAPFAEAHPVQGSLEMVKLQGGLHAVLHHKGPYPDMKPAYQWLFGEWLVQSGEEAADAPIFEEYLNNPRNTRPTELRTDIYLPLKTLAEAGNAR